MSPETFSLLGAALGAVCLIGAGSMCLFTVRWVRGQRETSARAAQLDQHALQVQGAQLQGKEAELATLKEEVAFLRELESVRFAQRYLETKNGLELRFRRLETQQERWRERERDAQKRLDELALTKEQKAGEVARMRAELTKTQLDGRTLEEALRAVSTLGEIPMADLKDALTRLRRRQAEITTRLDQLALEGEEKFAERDRVQHELLRARTEAERLGREIEITRAAGPMLDGLLGVSAEMQRKMERIEDRLGGSLRSLNGVRGHEPLAGFLKAVTGAWDPTLPSVGPGQTRSGDADETAARNGENGTEGATFGEPHRENGRSHPREEAMASSSAA